MVEFLSGPKRRLGRTPQEKITIIQQTMELGMTVTHVVCLHGINANQIFKRRRQYEDGSLTAVSSGEEVVLASKLAAACEQIRELKRLQDKKTINDGTTTASVRKMRVDSNTAWRAALKRAGIEDFRFHDLRHTWASWLIQAGVPLSALQEMGGWESIEMVQRYAHLAPNHLTEHARQIDAIFCSRVPNLSHVENLVVEVKG
jgi:integrase